MSSIWFSTSEVIPDKNRYNELISLIASHGLTITEGTCDYTTLSSDNYTITIVHDKYYSTITDIKIKHHYDSYESKYNYTWMRGFTMNDHRNVHLVLEACDEYVWDGLLDESIKYKFACSE